MKNYLLIFIAILSLHSCQQKAEPAQSPIQVDSTVYEEYGAASDAQSVLPMNDISNFIFNDEKNRYSVHESTGDNQRSMCQNKAVG